MILKYLRLRKRAAKDASGNSTTPRTGTLDLVNRDDRPFVRAASNDEAGLLVENGATVNSSARIDALNVGGVCVDGTTFSLGNIGFQFNASDGTSVTNSAAIPVKSQGTITFTDNPADGGTLDIGVDATGATLQYRFKTTPVQAKDIKIVADEDGGITQTIEHVISAINGTDGGFNTVANNQVTAANGAGKTVIVTAKYHGAAGDAVRFDEGSTNTAMDGSTTLGGTTAGVDQKYTPVDITAAAKAAKTGTFTAIAAADDTITVGTTEYTAIANGVTLTAGTFRIGSGGTSGTITNLIAAVNGTDGVNTADATIVLTAGSGAGEVDATAVVGGVAGNDLAIAEASSVFSWASGHTNLTGGLDATQDQSGAAIGVAVNGHADFTATHDAATDVVTVTHVLHGTVPNGYGYGEAVASAQVAWGSPTAGVDGAEGILGAQREDAGFLYTCTGAVAANKDYTWKKTALQHVTVAGKTTVGASDLVIPITHRFVDKSTSGGGETLTLADGTPGQKITVHLLAHGGGNGDLTPARKTGFLTVALDQAKDQVTLEYVDDTIGWIIVGAAGVAAPPVIT